MKKNGLKFLINAEKFVFDNMITNNINREKIVNLQYEFIKNAAELSAATDIIFILGSNL